MVLHTLYQNGTSDTKGCQRNLLLFAGLFVVKYSNPSYVSFHIYTVLTFIEQQE